MPYKLKDYPDNWRDEIRPAILKRDKFKCKYCGAKQRSYGYHDAAGRFFKTEDKSPVWNMPPGARIKQIFLAVAHLCHDPQCLDAAHLITVCQLHHNRLDSKMRGMRRRARNQGKKVKEYICSGRTKQFNPADNRPTS